MTVKKVFIDEKNKATFVCPKCNIAKTVDVSRYIGKAVRKKHIYRCSCGHSHTVLLERRKFFRKDVYLPGTYTIEKDNIERPLVVKDLSRSGLKLEVETTDHLSEGDKLVVEFRLDNNQRTLIRKEVFVKAILGKRIGTEFASRNLSNPFDKAYDVALGYYTFHQD